MYYPRCHSFLSSSSRLLRSSWRPTLSLRGRTTARPSSFWTALLRAWIIIRWANASLSCTIITWSLFTMPCTSTTWEHTMPGGLCRRMPLLSRSCQRSLVRVHLSFLFLFYSPLNSSHFSFSFFPLCKRGTVLVGKVV